MLTIEHKVESSKMTRMYRSVPTLRERIWEYLKARKKFTHVRDIYKHFKATTESEKVAIRMMLGKGIGVQFIRSAKYQGFYKAKSITHD